MSDEQDLKVRENRLRRMAQRQGFVLQKSRRRDRWATDYGTYRLVEALPEESMRRSGDRLAVWKSDKYPARVTPYRDSARAISGHHYGLTLDEVEAWLTGKRGPIELEGRES